MENYKATRQQWRPNRWNNDPLIASLWDGTTYTEHSKSLRQGSQQAPTHQKAAIDWQVHAVTISWAYLMTIWHYRRKWVLGKTVTSLQKRKWHRILSSHAGSLNLDSSHSPIYFKKTGRGRNVKAQNWTNQTSTALEKMHSASQSCLLICSASESHHEESVKRNLHM